MSAYVLQRYLANGRCLLLLGVVATMVGCQLQAEVNGNNGLTGGFNASINPTRSTSGGQIVRTGPYRGMKAPTFILSNAEGQEVHLKTLIGHPIYLNFWAASSPACLPFLKDIDRLYKAYGKDLVVISVNEGDTQASVRNLAEQEQYEWMFWVDPQKSVSDLYDLRAMPTSIFINKQGIITARSANVLSIEQLDTFARQAMGLNY